MLTLAAATVGTAATASSGPSLLAVWGALIGTLSLLLGLVRYILSSKINPLEKDVERLSKRLESTVEPLKKDIEQLKTDLLIEVKKIADDNHQFRIAYERDVAEIKLMLARNYVTKEECEKHAERLRDLVVAEAKKR